MSLHIIEGTWEEIESHKAELIGRQLRVIVKPVGRSVRATNTPKRASVLGKYAYVPGGSDEFAKEKQAEIDREDRERA